MPKPRQKGVRRAYLKRFSAATINASVRVPNKEYLGEASRRAVSGKTKQETYDALFPAIGVKTDAAGKLYKDDPRYLVFQKIREELSKKDEGRTLCIRDDASIRITLVFQPGRAFFVRELKFTKVFHQSMTYPSKETAFQRWKEERIRWIATILEPP